MKYSIFHPADGTLNLECSIEPLFVLVGEIEAYSLESAFRAAQNFDKQYQRCNKRSTSVGDLIKTDTGKIFMVMPSGFKEIKDTAMPVMRLQEAIRLAERWQVYQLN